MHLHHRLLEIGHSHRRAVLLIYLWAALLAFGAVALALIDDPFIVLWAVGIGLRRRRARLRRPETPDPAMTHHEPANRTTMKADMSEPAPPPRPNPMPRT